MHNKNYNEIKLHCQNLVSTFIQINIIFNQMYHRHSTSLLNHNEIGSEKNDSLAKFTIENGFKQETCNYVDGQVQV